MRIISVIPETHNGPSCTIITTVKDGKYINWHYSETYELLHDPNNPVQWARWNGGTLTEAIQWIINLPGSEKDNFSIIK